MASSIDTTGLNEGQKEILDQNEKYYRLNPGETIYSVLQRNAKSFYLPRIIQGVIVFVIYAILRYLILYDEIARSTIFTNITNGLLYAWIAYIAISLATGLKFVRGHVYIFTSKRIILIRKFLGVMFREIEYKRITDLVLHQSLWGRWFNFGNLMPVTAGIEMSAIKMGMYSIEGILDVFEVRAQVIAKIQEVQDKLLAQYIKEPRDRDTHTPDSDKE